MNIIIGIILGMLIPAAAFIGFCAGMEMTKRAIGEKKDDNQRTEAGN